MLAAGVLASNVLGKRLLHHAESLLMRVPVFSTIYSPVKQIAAAFSPDNESGFKRVVLVADPRRGWVVGFLTREFSMERGHGSEALMAVYVPTNHLYLGDVVVVPRDALQYPDLTVEDGVRIVLTGGMAFPDRVRGESQDRRRGLRPGVAAPVEGRRTSPWPDHDPRLVGAGLVGHQRGDADACNLETPAEGADVGGGRAAAVRRRSRRRSGSARRHSVAQPPVQTQAAESQPAVHHGGEASLVLPDLSQAVFLGVNGRTLLMYGLLVTLVGLLFGLYIYRDLKHQPVHASMSEIGDLIYETCKTYLLQQGKLLLILEVFIAVIIVFYFGFLQQFDATPGRGHPAVQRDRHRGQLRRGVVRDPDQYPRQFAHGVRQPARSARSWSTSCR